MNKLYIPAIIVVVVIVGLIILFKPKKEKFARLPNLRPLVSTQDNCSKCSTKYTKYAHNMPLNSDGQIIV
jgi:hypothetical protein